MVGSVAIGGAVVSWLRDKLGVIDSAAESESIASEVESTGGVYFVPAFSGLLAPYWEDSARGTIIGLTGITHTFHVPQLFHSLPDEQQPLVLGLIVVESQS